MSTESEEEQTLIAHTPVARNAFSFFQCLKEFICFPCPQFYPIKKLLSSEINLGPRVAGKKTLVLDIDETLVRSVMVEPDGNFDFSFDVANDGRMLKVYSIKRPGLDEFLELAKQLFEVVFFTASTYEYGNKLISIISPETPQSHRLFRDSCTYKNGFFIKNLNNINRDIRDLIIVDNNPISFLFNSDNGISAPSFYGEEDDCYLMDELIKKLQILATEFDVRVTITKNCWEFTTLDEAVGIYT